MASHHSGNDIIMVRVPGGAPERLSNVRLVVGDDTPWVDLGFHDQLKNELRVTLQEQADGKFYRSPEPADSTLHWMRWELWEPDKAYKRRRGEFIFGGGDTG